MEHFTYHIHSSVTLATSAISNLVSQENDDYKVQKISRLLLNSEERGKYCEANFDKVTILFLIFSAIKIIILFINVLIPFF